MSDLYAYIRALRGPILVTGASGFIGANLFQMIVAIRDDVFAVIQNKKNWRLENTPDKHLIVVDFNDYAATKNLINGLSPQTIFHCVAYGAYSFEKEANLIYQTNFQSLINFVDLLAKQQPAAFIHAGSSSEYGKNCAAPSENSIPAPNSHYAVSKVAAANYLQYLGKHHDFPCINLRLYSVYGPLEDTSRLFPTLLRASQAGRLIPFVDPHTSRDFIHIDDVCAAFIIAAARMHPGLYGENFNIGTGIKTTIADLAETTQRLFDITEQPKFGSMEGRSWDLADWYADPSKALKQLDWKSKITLEEGMLSMSTWVKQLTDTQLLKTTKEHLHTRKRSISAIIACYKDSQAIPIMYRRLTDTFHKIGVDYEIIFVNDGSPDNSAEVIREISKQDPRVIGISHSRNFGSQMAFRSGMEIFTMDSVVLLDGDLQDPPELIEAFHTKWEAGYEVVYGRRIKRDMPWYWGLMYKLFYRIFAMFSYVNIPLDAGDFSLMDRRIVAWLLKCPERDLFIRGLRAYVGFKQVGVDYVRPERMFGTSTNNFINNIEWAKKGIFSFSNTPLTMLTYIGIMTFSFSILVAVAVAILRILLPESVPRGITTLLISVMLFGSFNIFAIGLLGEYIAKIMTEIKKRPRMIRSALIRNGQVSELLPDGKGR